MTATTAPALRRRILRRLAGLSVAALLTAGLLVAPTASASDPPAADVSGEGIPRPSSLATAAAARKAPLFLGGESQQVSRAVPRRAIITLRAWLSGGYGAKAVKVRVRTTGSCLASPTRRIAVAGRWKNVDVRAGIAKTWVTTRVKLPADCDYIKNPVSKLPGPHWLELAVATRTSTKVRGSVPQGFFNVYKPHTKANAGLNLALRIKKPRYAKLSLTLPSAYSPRLSRAGLNVYNPAYLAWWCDKPGVRTGHRANIASYNQRWRNWMAWHPRPTKAQVLDFRKATLRQYKLSC